MNSSVQKPCVLTSALLSTLIAVIPLHAQEASENRIWSVYQRVQASSSSFGQILKMNTNLGVDFNKHIGIDAGLPYYIVNYAAQGDTAGGVKTGAGNAYADLRLNLNRSLFGYSSTLTVTAPTGSQDKGLSTGHATVDWNNGFYRVFAERISPYVNVGVANTVSDTPFFLQPFSSEGLVTHFEAGTTASLSRFVALGASAYAVVPSGEQTIVSRIVEVHTETEPAKTLPSNSRGRGLGLTKQPKVNVFETVREVVGTAELANDHRAETVVIWRRLVSDRQVQR